MSISREVLRIPLLTEEAFFSWFGDESNLLKYQQEFQVAYQSGQLKKLIFDYTPGS